MTPEEIKNKVLEFGDWEIWADRPFGAFVLSLTGSGREVFKKIGLNWEHYASLFQNGVWYKSIKVWNKNADLLVKNNIDLFKVVNDCEVFYENGKSQIRSIIVSSGTPIGKLKELKDLLLKNMAYTWITHAFEHLYTRRLHEEVPKYYSGDITQFIGDVSYPVKRNKHSYFIEVLASDEPLEKIQQEYGWIKIRDGFNEPYSIQELSAERQRLRKENPRENFKRPNVPVELKDLEKAAQELVYFRTFRTDVLWEFMYLIRPILKEVADFHNIPFTDLRNYSVEDLISGNLRRYENVAFVAIGDQIALFNGPILDTGNYTNAWELKGGVAFKGIVRGKAKVVMTAYEINKVEKGDILVAPTTAPSYIVGMSKAVAFVTDEGGITSHASIVAREMKKPCIIGTKNATRLLKDGDFIEVDAEQGIIKILKRNV